MSGNTARGRGPIRRRRLFDAVLAAALAGSTGAFFVLCRQVILDLGRATALLVIGVAVALATPLLLALDHILRRWWRAGGDGDA